MQGSLALTLRTSSMKGLCGRCSSQIWISAISVLLAIVCTEAFHHSGMFGKAPALRSFNNHFTPSKAVLGALHKPSAEFHQFSSNRINPSFLNLLRPSLQPALPSKLALFAGKQQKEEPIGEDELEGEPPEVETISSMDYRHSILIRRAFHFQTWDATGWPSTFNNKIPDGLAGSCARY